VDDPHAHLNALNASRRRLLLEGTDREVDKIEAEIATCSRECDRFDHAVAKLESEIAAADAKEARDALTAKRDQIEKRAQAFASKELKLDYVRYANGLVDVLEGLTEIEAEVESINAELRAAGRVDETLQPVEPRVRAAYRQPPDAASPPLRGVGFPQRGVSRMKFRSIVGKSFKKKCELGSSFS